MASKRAEIERIELAAPERLINRELSWLDFNARVLDLADDQDLPLLERVRFCSIFSSNLDEFFMVRVAGLLRQAAAGIGVRSADGRTSQVVLSDIRERVIELSLRQSQVWMVDLRKALDAAGICIVPVAELDEDELSELSATFEREVFPVLTPLGVGPGQPFRTSPGYRSAWACSSVTRTAARSGSPGSRCRRCCRGSCMSARAGGWSRWRI